MNLQKAKKIIKNSEPKIVEAHKFILLKEWQVNYENYQKQIQELDLQLKKIRQQRSDLMFVENWEDLQKIVKNIFEHGDTIAIN